LYEPYFILTMYQNIDLRSNKYFTGAVLILVFLIGLGIGLLIKNGQSAPIVIDKNMKIGLPQQTQFMAQKNIGNGLLGNFLASINGKAYYPKGCTAANKIKEENRIWFTTRQEAEAQGYKPAQNCAF